LFDLALSIKVWLACCQFHKNAPETPNIDFKFVASASIKHLRRFVPPGEPFELIFLSFRALDCRPEVTKFQPSFGIDDDITRFQVPMNVPLVMENFQPIQDLTSNLLNLEFIDGIRALINQSSQVMLAQFHHDVGVEVVLNDFVNFEDVFVVWQVFEDFQFPLDVGRG